MLKKFVFIFVVLAAIFILEQYRLFSVLGVNPNLFLVAFLFFIFNARTFWFAALVAASLLIFVLVFSPYLAVPFAVLLLLVLASYPLKKFMTGTPFLDFLALVLASTLVFYLLVGIFRLSSLPVGFIILEALYNLVLGAVVWFALGERSKLK